MPPLLRWRTAIRLAVFCLIAALSQTPVTLAQQAKDIAKDALKDPAWEALNKAFEALRIRDYDTAISFFGKAEALSPTRPDIRKNLAYTLLKTGDSDTAREEFGEAMRLDPSDLHLALEYAFLCYEAREDAPGRKAEARRIFDRVRHSADPTLSATASQAFQNIDGPLAEGIARWQHVLATSAPTFSALYELAQLAEQRDELELAAAKYKAAFQLLPERKSVLLELARVEKARGNSEGMMAALLAASRGGETRAAERAREQMPDRYPYVYEFRKALELDPKNEALHRELAYLLLRMSEEGQVKPEEAREEFQRIVETSPGDFVSAAQLGMLYLAANQTDLAMPILQNVMAHGDSVTANRVRMALKLPPVLEERRADNTASAPAADPRLLAEHSYNAGFLKDAKRYYLIAREQNPVDASIALKLGWTNNMLHDDVSAMRWFDIARQSDDPAITTEANRAYENLRPDTELFRSTMWLYPLFSSRWHDVFGYGQLKTELRLKTKWIRPYASLRFVGDERRTTGGIAPQSLSESSFIAGIGVASRSWHGALGWFEAGTSLSYLNGSHMADYRGGVSYSKTLGRSLASERSGWFVEMLGDSVYVRRFDNDLLNYSQNRIGYTSAIGEFKIQTYWSENLTFDVKHEYWANFVETGPGIRLHPPRTPKSFYLTLGGVRGAYLTNGANPYRPNFFDFRTGIWYAFTK